MAKFSMKASRKVTTPHGEMAVSRSTKGEITVKIPFLDKLREELPPDEFEATRVALYNEGELSLGKTREN